MNKNIPDIDIITGEVCEFLRSSVLADGISFDKNSSFSSLGIDSFSIIEILLFIERRFDIIVPETHLSKENLKSATALSRCAHLAASQVPAD